MTKEYEHMCDICGSKANVFGYKKGVKTLKCTECSFMWKDRQSFPEDYYKTWKYGTSRSFDLRNQESVFQYRLDKIHSVLSGSSLKIMDFGCGKGEFVEYLRKKGYEAYGCDVGDNIPDKEYFFKTDISDLSEYDFDVIFSSETFEHLENTSVSSIMSSLSARLKKNGIIYIETQFTHADSLFGWGYFDKANHISFFNPDSMSALMKSSGVDLIYFDKRNQERNILWAGRKIIHISHRIIPDPVQRSFMYKKSCALVLKFAKKILGSSGQPEQCKDWTRDILKKMNCTFIGKKK